MPTLIDLSRPLEHIPIEAFPDALKPLYRIISPEIEYVEHGQGAGIMQAIFGCQKADLPEGEGWAEENVTFSTHLGTHVDAPWHYGSKTGEEAAITVDQIPLDELYLDGVVLDLSHLKGSGKAITVDDLKAALARIDYKIKERDAVLLRTDHDKFALTDPLRYNYPGLTAESATYIAAQGATVGGTDALGWDRPFHVMVQEYQTTKDKNKIWDAHYALRQYRFYVVQQLANLDKLPAKGFKVSFFPLKIKGASAAPARVVAFVD
ncbi:MAG: cyclase family protein [Cyanobacteria bacterium SZAS LIN-3]|nr:cyclase family protein [Cyanobacteria bacterium SZAS LIN-3]